MPSSNSIFYHTHSISPQTINRTCFYITTGQQSIFMILYYLILISTLPLTHPQTYTIENQQLSIKAGIAIANFNNQTSGTLIINYAKAMPDNAYNTLATMAYINNYLPSKGLNFSANCSSESNQVQIKCAVIAHSSSSNNILYLTYVVSDQTDFMVGSFPILFTLNSTTLKTPIDYNLSLPSDSPFKVARNNIDFIPMVSGISSLDSDFGLLFNIDQNFQTTSLCLHFSVTINEFHEKNLTVIFGYILFLADQYPVTVYASKRYEPNNPDINKNILYGINQINTISLIGQNRKLAPSDLVPNNSSLIYRVTAPTSNNQSYNDTKSANISSDNTASKSTAYTNKTSNNTSSTNSSPSNSSPSNSSSSNSPYSTTSSTANAAQNPVRLLQIVEQSKLSSNLNATLDKPTSSVTVKPDKFTAYISEFQKLISDDQFDLKQVKVRSVTEQLIKNKTVPSNNSNIYKPVAPTTPTLNASLASKAPVTSPLSLVNEKAVQPAPAPAPIIPTAPDTNDFDQIFSTNGFSFIVNTTISDPVLYLELDPYVNIQSAKTLQNAQAYNYIITTQPQPSPIYIKQPINTQVAVPIDCPIGFMVSVQKRISILQRAYRSVCVYCFWQQYFDWSLKKCMDLPAISEFVNVVDPVT